MSINSSVDCSARAVGCARNWRGFDTFGYRASCRGSRPPKPATALDARNGAFEDINLAFEHQETGKVVKPLIRF